MSSSESDMRFCWRQHEELETLRREPFQCYLCCQRFKVRFKLDKHVDTFHAGIQRSRRWFERKTTAKRLTCSRSSLCSDRRKHRRFHPLATDSGCIESETIFGSEYKSQAFKKKPLIKADGNIIESHPESQTTKDSQLPKKGQEQEVVQNQLRTQNAQDNNLETNSKSILSPSLKCDEETAEDDHYDYLTVLGIIGYQ